MNYVLSLFRVNLNPGDTQGIKKVYPLATEDLDKKVDKFYISVSNIKEIVDHFISIYNKYGWGGFHQW